MVSTSPLHRSMAVCGTPTPITGWPPQVPSLAWWSRISASRTSRPHRRPSPVLRPSGRKWLARRQWDESDVRIRPGRGTRPRTKDLRSHEGALVGMVVTKDRGRWGVVLDGRTDAIITMRARELGRTAIEVGDRVAVVGDTSGQPGTLARIV